MDFTVCVILCVFQCLNLLQSSDCEQTNGRVCDDSLLNLKFERTTNIRIRRVGTSTEIATFPFRCSATNTLHPRSPSPPSPPPSALSIHTVPHHASPGQDERVQSLRRVNPQPIHNFLQKLRTETASASRPGERLTQERVHKASFRYCQGN